MQAYLVISQGSRWTDIFRLQGEISVVIGRSSDNQIVIRDDRASRRHAEITLRQGVWTVRDLGSRNGTQVNNHLLADEHPLADGDAIVVAGCRMTFVLDLAHAFGPQASPEAMSSAASGHVSSAQTIELGLTPPTIVGRRNSSRWSGRGAPAGDQASDAMFLYRLVYEMVSIPSASGLAQCALDKLLDRLGITTGGVLLINAPVPPVPASNSITSNSLTSNSIAGGSIAGGAAESPTVSFQAQVPGAAINEGPQVVLAARQAPGQAYRRVSDFLVASVVREGSAVLARNVQMDTQLSLARESGQRQTSSIICAPLKQGQQVVGLLHVYTALDERMLTDADLELAVAVADSLAVALSHQSSREQLSQSLATSQRKIDLLERELGWQHEMVGNSPAMLKVRSAIERAGPTGATILVRGESGVGKELVARAIHMRSPRRQAPLVCLNCAALAPTLLESELFGHEKGAFTGATERKIGKFEAANGGTLMLDEIGEMIPELQAKFLRVLEGQSFERLGGNKPIHTNVRVIAATNRDLEQAVRDKQFRSDLYFRLRVIEIDVPPLRERTGDVAILAEHFLTMLRAHAGRRIDGIAPATLELLQRYNWPGNVRELRNVIERAVVLGSSSVIEPEDVSLAPLAPLVPAPLGQATGTGDANNAPTNSSLTASSNVQMPFRAISLEQLEKEHILATLAAYKGNKSRAAIVLGVERSTLDRKLKKYEQDEV
ncbi:MAG: sigma 54-interacting transcriptional regulator [Pirellulaceae bacterium]|nr:sigma 54-interacting transcriptional regulator [Pirellulaceae bacterium]